MNDLLVRLHGATFRIDVPAALRATATKSRGF
jgi:hypothetical protein